ncbi:MAG: amidohydrolase family protein [Acidobacteriota bacterium]|nr:amidohydrolase family protein [Acidobacteriota bacterium]
MKRLTLLLTTLLWLGLFSDVAHQQTDLLAIVGATVIDGTGAEPKKQTVLIRGERIEAVTSPDTQPPANARIINAAGLTLMPGIFDLHTHLPYASGGGVTGDWPKNLKAYLYCGVTSVVDFGTYPETFEPMRRLIRTGIVEAPRISLAARMTTPGGHGAEGGRGDFFSLEVTTPREARAAVRRVLPYQPDAIKVFTDGWRYGAAADMTSMNEETLTALVDEAHKNGIEVLTHTVSLDKAKIAARSKVDVIAHGIGDRDADEELFKAMKASGTTYAPTLAVYEPRGRDILSPLLDAVLEPAVKNGINPPLAPPQNPPLKPAAGSAENGDAPRLRRWATLQRNTAALRKAGITFGTGTDAGVTGTHHGWATLRELQLLVAGGLTPLEAITAATGNAARAIKVDGERGTIAVGKLADLILIAGEPHKTIGDIEKISRVFLGGRELDREKMAREIASTTLTAIPAVKAQELIDDFERADGRSRLDTRWVNSSDAGVDPSKIVFGKVARGESNQALSVSARMSEKERPFARVNVPLSRGAVETVDARAFSGVQFDVRGDGEYRLIVPIYNTRSVSSHFSVPFSAKPQWQTVKLDFASFKQSGARSPVQWTGADLLMLSFEIARPAGGFGWLELDDIKFYR